MNAQDRKSALILGICLVLGLASLGYLLGHAALSVKKLERSVTVKGLSEREVSANVAIWPISFSVADNQLEAVFNALESNTALITRYLGEFGIVVSEISVSPPTVTDLYAQEWGDKSNIKYRYTASGYVTIYTDKVDAVRKAMAGVVELGKQGVLIAGGPGNGDDQFLFTELNALKPAMIEEATKNARAVAEKFAADSNSKLGKIRSANQGQFSIQSRDSNTPYIKNVRIVSTIEYYLAD